MENSVFVALANNTTFDIIEMDQLLPKELQMPVGIAVCWYFARDRFFPIIIFISCFGVLITFLETFHG